MEKADRTTARGAIRRSAATRERLRGQSPDGRDDQLRAALDDLSAAMVPINAELRSGPLTGRLKRNREAREVSAALQAERAKVRGMLRRASGGRKRRKPYRREQFRAFIGHAVRQADRIESELDNVMPQMRPGSQDYREEAQRLLGDVERLQRLMTQRRAQARHWARAGAWGKPTTRDKTLFATSIRTAAQVKRLRRRAKIAAAVPINIGFTRQRPTPPVQRRRRWTESDAWAALVAYTAANGRPPRAADYRGNPELPSYASVHKLFGGLPDAADLLYDAKPRS